MTIKQQVCFVVKCSDCSDILEYDGYTPHFDSDGDARALLGDCEWWSDGTVEICHGCKHKPHEFIPEIAGRDDVACDRCGLDQDDHQTATQPQVSAAHPVSATEFEAVTR